MPEATERLLFTFQKHNLLKFILNFNFSFKTGLTQSNKRTREKAALFTNNQPTRKLKKSPFAQNYLRHIPHPAPTQNPTDVRQFPMDYATLHIYYFDRHA